MKSRKPAARQGAGQGQHRGTSDRRRQRLLSVRSALVLELALLSALGGAGLLYLAHRSAVQIVLSALGICGVALKLFDSLIE